MNDGNHRLSYKTLQHEKSREQTKDWRADQPCDEKWSLGVRMGRLWAEPTLPNSSSPSTPSSLFPGSLWSFGLLTSRVSKATAGLASSVRLHQTSRCCQRSLLRTVATFAPSPSLRTPPPLSFNSEERISATVSQLTMAPPSKYGNDEEEESLLESEGLHSYPPAASSTSSRSLVLHLRPLFPLSKTIKPQEAVSIIGRSREVRAGLSVCEI